MIVLEKSSTASYHLENQHGVSFYGVNSKREKDGFTPFELICSSVSLCMALSIDALIERDDLDVQKYTIKVEPHKAEDRPSRIERFSVEVEIIGDVDEKAKQKLSKSAERACTIGNTLKKGAEMEISLK